MPPISCTSKCRMLSTRRPASRTTANASGSRSSSVSPLASRSRNSAGLAAQLLVGQRLNRRLEGVDLAHDRAQALQFAFVLGADDFGEECIEHLTGNRNINKKADSEKGGRLGRGWRWLG